MEEHNVTMADRSFRPARKRKVLRGVLLLLFLAVFGGVVWFGARGELPKFNIMTVAGIVPSSGYQAVFLEGGQVYFGKLELGDKKWLILRDVYYLQTSQGVQPSQSNFQLVKLGSEIYGPEDSMYLSPSKVLYWENIKDDSKIADAIAKFKAGQE